MYGAVSNIIRLISGRRSELTRCQTFLLTTAERLLWPILVWTVSSRTLETLAPFQAEGTYVSCKHLASYETEEKRRVRWMAPEILELFPHNVAGVPQCRLGCVFLGRCPPCAVEMTLPLSLLSRS
jgi:hypothetical protein